jgi:hypothetical protein
MCYTSGNISTLCKITTSTTLSINASTSHSRKQREAEGLD